GVVDGAVGGVAARVARQPVWPPRSDRGRARRTAAGVLAGTGRIARRNQGASLALEPQAGAVDLARAGATGQRRAAARVRGRVRALHGAPRRNRPRPPAGPALRAW